MLTGTATPARLSNLQYGPHLTTCTPVMMHVCSTYTCQCFADADLPSKAGLGERRAKYDAMKAQQAAQLEALDAQQRSGKRPREEDATYVEAKHQAQVRACACEACDGVLQCAACVRNEGTADCLLSPLHTCVHSAAAMNASSPGTRGQVTLELHTNGTLACEHDCMLQTACRQRRRPRRRAGSAPSRTPHSLMRLRPRRARSRLRLTRTAA